MGVDQPERASPTGVVPAGVVPAGVVPAPQEVRAAYWQELRPQDRSTLWSWIGFTTTFATVRTITYSIRRGRGPFRNMSVGGVHLHHYMWGIGMLGGVGAVALFGEERDRERPATALVYGSGLALIVDEFALLLDLKDVYWAKQGRVSIDIGVGIVALGGTLLSAVPIIGRLVRDRTRRRFRHAASRSAAPVRSATDVATDDRVRVP